MGGAMTLARKNVGYIGLGNIGKPCAHHLIGDHFKAHVYDVSPEPVKELVDAGAVGCDGVAQLAQACEHIGICVRDETQVEALLYGDGGIFAHAKAGTVLAVHSTVTREAILKWAAVAQQKRVQLIDAGISGGAQGAEAGTLVYMVGGDAETVERARPVFATSATSVIHAGEIGAGMVLKLCNNLITYAQFMAMSEATRLAEACGMSADTLREVGKTNGVVSEQMHMFISNRNALAAACSEEDMAAMFGPFGELGEKDLDCALACASQLGLQLPATRRLRESVYDLFLNKD
jgi:3-hydroxyisobutyrate dehydrogenase